VFQRVLYESLWTSVPLFTRNNDCKRYIPLRPIQSPPNYWLGNKYIFTHIFLRHVAENSICRTKKSSFLDRHEKVVAVTCNDVTVTRPTKQTRG
jgi:hypothetical protein